MIVECVELMVLSKLSGFSPESVVDAISKAILDFKPRLEGGWNGKQKRSLQRLLSGLTRARSRGDRMRFMTLTTAVGGSFERLRRDFQTLRKRIEHEFRFLAQYWSVRTDEGNGVLHIVFKGGFIPHAWLSKAWESIHGAKIVDIREIKGSSKRVASYLISNYLCKQSFERMSWSWNWVFRGFCGLWHTRFSAWYRRDSVACLKAWNDLICHFSRPVSVVHGSLGG